jgi:hypothetical protein
MAQSHVVLCRPGKFSGKEKLNFFAGASDPPALVADVNCERG